MNDSHCLIVKTLLTCFGLLFLVMPIQVAYSQSTTTIDATVRLSVCGDNVAEGNEDCDNEDFRSKTCLYVGYARGTLACDIACTFDISGCVDKLPTATPTQLATPTPSQTEKPTTTSVIETSSPMPVLTPEPLTPLSVLNPLPILKNITKTQLPQILSAFDFDGDKRIEKQELYQAVKLWVDEWRSTGDVKITKAVKTLSSGQHQCDINTDSMCDISDLSILLFYIER